jgi:hypothetical protein
MKSRERNQRSAFPRLILGPVDRGGGGKNFFAAHPGEAQN